MIEFVELAFYLIAMAFALSGGCFLASPWFEGGSSSGRS
jgi:hypothetical protein